LIADVESGIAAPEEEEDCPQACNERGKASKSHAKEHLESMNDGLPES
jgi:hypothetical protein